MRRRLSYSNVTATLALFVAHGGPAGPFGPAGDGFYIEIN